MTSAGGELNPNGGAAVVDVGVQGLGGEGSRGVSVDRDGRVWGRVHIPGVGNVSTELGGQVGGVVCVLVREA